MRHMSPSRVRSSAAVCGGRPTPADVAIAALVAGPFGGWTVLLLWLAAPTVWLPVLVPAVVVGFAALAWRRAAPAAAFAVAAVAGTAQIAVPGGLPLLPSLVVFPLCLHAYVAYGSPRSPRVGLGVGLSGAVVATASAALLHPWRLRLPLALLGGFLMATVLVAFSLGLFHRIQVAYVAELEHRAARAEADREERALRAVQDERTRIAREMHDLIAHSLSVIVSQARGGRYAAQTDPERAARVLGTVEDIGRQALTDMRGLLGVLRTGDGAEPFGPQPDLAAVPDLLDRVRESGLIVESATDGTPGRLAPAAELAAYRLVQEALTNVLKHAGPGARAKVLFRWSDTGLEIEVGDDGDGPRPDPTAGHGLIGMRERMAIVGGTVRTGPGPDAGFLVSARIPRPASQEAGAR
jgi:signal transduction histidine kinase